MEKGWTTQKTKFADFLWRYTRNEKSPGQIEEKLRAEGLEPHRVSNGGGCFYIWSEQAVFYPSAAVISASPEGEAPKYSILRAFIENEYELPRMSLIKKLRRLGRDILGMDVPGQYFLDASIR